MQHGPYAVNNHGFVGCAALANDFRRQRAGKFHGHVLHFIEQLFAMVAVVLQQFNASIHGAGCVCDELRFLTFRQRRLLFRSLQILRNRRGRRRFMRGKHANTHQRLVKRKLKRLHSA